MSGRWYLAGPMAGIENLNFPLFHYAARILRQAGREIINPAEINSNNANGWADCMRADIRELVTCDGILLLPGWEKSRGAVLEHHIAAALGMKVEWIGVMTAAPGDLSISIWTTPPPDAAELFRVGSGSILAPSHISGGQHG